ncbi:hypothetical protein FACS189487_09390 [Campylobacterota bacterium]|nr:hypothetical protein FACS189487_09390 [Campylobacterota bacterium]
MLGVLNFTLKNITESRTTIIDTRDAGVNAGVNAGVKNSSTQMKIFSLIQKNNRITQVEIGKKLNINKSTVYRNIQQLKQMNLIKRVGSDKTGHWKVVSEI